MKKRILIVEDDVYIAEDLSCIIQELGYDVTGIAFDTKSAIDSLNQQPPDLAILDIRMHGKNQGFEIARYINDNVDIPFIFLTSFSDKVTVEEASLLKPNAYILKPFNSLEIYTTLAVVFESFEKKSKIIAIKIGQNSTLFDSKELLWIKSDDNYIELNTGQKRYVVRATIDGFLEKHGLSDFVRVHRSYAVNLSKIEALNSSQLTINGIEIPISKKYVKDLRILLHP